MNSFFNTNKKELILIRKDITDDICKYCGIECYLMDSYYLCPECGICTDTIVISDFIDPMDIKKHYPYKQTCHFRYKLLKLQGIDKDTIPQSLIDTLKKHKYETIVELHYIMKKYKMRLFYKNIIYIDYLIKGRFIHSINSELHYLLLQNFYEIQETYYKIFRKGKQMINYNFIIFKLCMLYGRQDIAKNAFFIIKYEKTITNYDSIWKKICENSSIKYRDTMSELELINKDIFNQNNISID